MANTRYNLIEIENAVPIKAWTKGVKLEDEAKKQLLNVAQLPFVYKWVAAMPDVHWGLGATIGSVIPTKGAIIPAAVGVDLGCGMMAVQTTLNANHLPNNLRNIRRAIEKAVPHGRTDNGGKRDKGAWGEIPRRQIGVWRQLEIGYKAIIEKYPKLDRGNHVNHLGTLGSGNHFIELCLDESDQVWFMLHSGSRGVGNRIGTFFIEMAKNDMQAHIKNLPDKDLAYFNEGAEHFYDYVEAVHWAQEFAMYNRKLMMEQIVDAVADSGEVPEFELTETAVNCHHNYVAIEEHYGEEVFVTRKGAVRARKGDMGIIPGSMGARSYIVRGLGNDESFHSCFPKGTKALTEKGVMLIEDVFRCANDIRLITYNAEAQRFEAKAIVDKSLRTAPTASYAVSQTGRRIGNVIVCTDDHPFATYVNASLVYRPVSEIATLGGVIVPTELNAADRQAETTETELSLHYLIGLILSDGTMFFQEWDVPPSADGRPRRKKYKQAYIRIYQSASDEKAEFIKHVCREFARFTSSVGVRKQSPRTAVLKGRAIQSQGLVEITVFDEAFVEEVKRRIASLSTTLLQNRALALHFLAGYLDGDGSYGRDHAAISIGKQTNFSPVLCALLSLGVPYRVYNNRDHYVLEFRNNSVLEGLRGICKRLHIASLPERLYGERLVLAQSVLSSSAAYEIRRKAQVNGLINLERLPITLQLDPKLSMNRIRRIGPTGDQEVYNFTLEANHNFIVMTDFYTPLLVHNCSHGAGRAMSRNEAKRRFTTADHEKATAGIECRKDEDVIDETPAAYKDIESVMNAQSDLVEIAHTLRQVVCVKG
jgi:tRNA-splicing ligase RtcB